MKIYKIHDLTYKLDRNILGNKATNLANIARLNLPTPSGFTISTDIWRQVQQNQGRLPNDVWEQVKTEVKSFKQPFLISVRSGSAHSMPGMMDSVLNVGLNDDNLELLIEQIGEWAACDSYRRLIQMFGATVYKIHEGLFIETIDDCLEKENLKSFLNISIKQLRKLIKINKNIVRSVSGQMFPHDPFTQLKFAIESVFNSWNKPGAISYRDFHGIPHDIGTAVIIQQMVFGNAAGNSGTGVYFTRNPKTGSKKPFGEILFQAQGEDVVGGYHHPQSFEKFEELFGQKLLNELTIIGHKLEKHFHKTQDIEFTIENGKLFVLQTRAAKLTGKAVFQIVEDMLSENLISLHDAIRLIQPGHIIDVTRGKFVKSDKELKQSWLTTGVPASSGVASGIITLSPQQLRKNNNKGKQSILLMDHIDPNDVDTLIKSDGVITTRGGSASHMAIIMRALGLPGIVGCQDIRINKEKKFISVNGFEINEGNWISFNGNSGEIFQNKIEIQDSQQLTDSEQKIISLRNQHLGASAWSAACYKTNRSYSRSQIIKKINEFLKNHNWRSTKAMVIALLNHVFPEKEMISSQVLSPNDKDKIVTALKEVIDEGYENAPRTTHFPEKLAGAPWAYGPNKIKKIDQFINGDWPGKYGGLKDWKKDPELETVIVSKEQSGKMDVKLSKEHFTFTISIMEGLVSKIIVSINLGSPHLREFERASADDLIIITTSVNENAPLNLGLTSLQIGRKHLQTNIAQKIYSSESTSHSKLQKIIAKNLDEKRDEQLDIEDQLIQLIKKGIIPIELHKYIINSNSLEVINNIKDKVFNSWWKQPISLPHLMCALEDTIGTSVLEGQGRISKGNVKWCLVYGVKGSEEKEKAKQVKVN